MKPLSLFILLATFLFSPGAFASGDVETVAIDDNPYNTYDGFEPHVAEELERIATIPSEIPVLITSPGYKPCREIMKCQFVEYWLMDEEQPVFALDLRDFYPAAKRAEAMEEINTQEILIVFRNKIYQIDEIRIQADFIIHLITTRM